MDHYIKPTPIMKQLKNQILGTIAFLLLFVGLTNAAQSIDLVSQDSATKQEIKEFAGFSVGGVVPK